MTGLFAALIILLLCCGSVVLCICASNLNKIVSRNKRLDAEAAERKEGKHL